MRQTFLLLLVFILYNTALAQQFGSVSGKISGSEGAIPGATVRILGSETGGVADAEGRFRLEDVKPGAATLEFRSIGFKTITQEIQIAPGETKELRIIMEQNSLGLDEVVVTGTMKPTFVKASPIKVEVVTSQYINTFSPAAASSIVEGIKLVNGVQEVVACGVCFTNSISINGLPGPYTAILMDGTPIYGNLASVYGLNGIPNMIIDRFEVIKGPSSTLYGSEAVAGVINIITKDPEDQPKLSIDIMGTSHLESFGNISTAPKIGRSTGFIGLNYAYINDFDDRNTDGFGDIANLDRYSLFTKWNLYRKSNRRFTLAAKYYYEDRRNGVEEFLNNRNYKALRGSDSIYGESIYTHRAELFGTYELPTYEHLKIDYSFSRHLQDSYYGADHYEAEQAIAFTNFIWDKEIASHSLLAGLTTRYQYYDDNTVATADGSDNKPNNQFIPGIFLQDEWKITPAFTLLTGGRLDHYSEHGYIFSPRMNVKIKASEWTTIRANTGTGFRIVNLFTEDHAFVTGQRSVEITEALKPERSYNGALNVNHVYTVGRSQGTIDVDAYYTYFTNKIIPDYSDPERIIYANTNGHAITKGIGFNITHEFVFPLSVNLGYNMQEVTQTEPNEQNIIETTDIEFAPQWSSIFTANYTLSELKMTLGYTFRLTGPMALPEVYDVNSQGELLSNPRALESDPFAIHNVQAVKEFNSRWSVYAGVQNIFDYIQPVSPLTGYNDPTAPAGFSQYFDTAYSFAPIHGREFYLGIKWDLQ
ncbi:TonB-dependent receptor [Fulvivirga imtechensis AK7]|uniref:TonB-dependent receptor n=1 Tax=Fulvivirga imtechensis AK7 TaxID=1237149 RepID=L8JW35_9BACT|nr:TonB-dependent receptor [Fulvivirga imtechensis]ELR71447.1 TonB-dependent receptor [Fulvivirga imtechensis AK7]